MIMVGPDPGGMGGISRVAQIWESHGIFERSGIKYITSVCSGDSKLKLFHSLQSIVKFILSLLTNKTAAVYIHTAVRRSFYRKSAYIIIAALLRKRIILHIHPSDFSVFLQNADGIKRALVLFVLKRVGYYVVLTEGMKDFIRERFPDRGVYVLRNPVDVESMNKYINMKRLPNRVLYLGWYVEDKGIYELVDALRMLSGQGIDVSADFYGTKDREQLERYVAERNMSSRITVNGWISGEAKLRILSGCTMLALPSRSEGIPNVILEAMAAKTPIVATQAGGLAEVLRHNENAIITKIKDPEDLGEKILSCLQDEGLRRKIAENAYEEALTKYDITVVGNAMSGILDEILGSSDGPRPD